MTTLAMPRPGIAGLITDDTILCRCERLQRAELDRAISQGAVTLNDLKSATRCGMGPCGGRNCEYAASLLISVRTGQALPAIAQPTARPPLRPVPLQALAGSFDYASLPMPEPAAAVTTPIDLAVIGGGVMGCSAALRAAEGGMRVALLEQAALGSGASGVNAGTLSLQIKRLKLMPYALRGYDWWQAAGDAVGFHRAGGLTLAFTQQEADLLAERMTQKRAAGAPIELVSARDALAREPALSHRVVAASWCAADGYANSSRTGMYFRGLLAAAGIETHEYSPVQDILQEGSGFTLRTPSGTVQARRLLLAAGGWTGPLAGRLGFDVPIRVRVNTVSVTARAPPLVGAVIGHVTGLLTLKQKQNGTVLIGGGWQGRGTPQHGRGEVVPETLLTNLRLAQFAVPALGALRVARAWTGFEANVPDFYPLAGAIPGIANAYILACVRGGYTIGPYIGRLMGDMILDRQPEMPLFDPARFLAQAAASVLSRMHDNEISRFSWRDPGTHNALP